MPVSKPQCCYSSRMRGNLLYEELYKVHREVVPSARAFTIRRSRCGGYVHLTTVSNQRTIAYNGQSISSTAS